MDSKLGVLRATWLVSVACLGSFLFAYDTGVVGGILTLESFQRDFGYYGSSEGVLNSVNGNSGSILQGGAFLGCFIIWPITSRFGRRPSLGLASIVFELGTILQTSNTGKLWVFYTGRAVSGVAVGACTVLIPIFASEMSPKEVRGRLGSFFQLFFAIGVAASYWIDYAVSTLVESSTRQWQIPLAIQLIPGALLGLGMLLVPESARWLVKRDRVDDARAALMWVRADGDGEGCRAELAEIVASVGEEARAAAGLSWRELLVPANRRRILLSITLHGCQQLTGNTSLTYFAPQIFGAIAGGSPVTDVYLTGFFGIVKVTAVIAFMTFFIDRIGRKPAFMGGAGAMGACMLAIALLVSQHPPSAGRSRDHSDAPPSPIGPYGIAAVALTYLEAFFFNLSWGPLAWLYLGEIFPSRIRDVGVAIGAGAQWAANFGMAQATPHALGALGWRTFLLLAGFNFALVLYSYLFIVETSGRSLEEMDLLFGCGRIGDCANGLAQGGGRPSRHALHCGDHGQVQDSLVDSDEGARAAQAHTCLLPHAELDGSVVDRRQRGSDSGSIAASDDSDAGSERGLLR